jgi:hypothetical protein
MVKYRVIYLWLLSFWLMASVAAAEITPNEVYGKAYVIREEIEILKRHFHIEKSAATETVHLALTPGHSWQKGYEILYKINVFRSKHGLSFSSVPSREPQQEVSPLIAYEQLIRIITELQIIKFYADITEAVAQPPIFTGKMPVDVYNLLNETSHELDILNGKPLSPSDGFAQAVRITEDVDFILKALNITDTTIPPPKVLAMKPADVFEVVLQLLVEMRRVQKLFDMNWIDFHTLKPTDREITPSDVFSLDGIVLAELQPIKARLGLKYALTPMAQHYENIEPNSQYRTHGWTLRKLQLIRSLAKSQTVSNRSMQ